MRPLAPIVAVLVIGLEGTSAGDEPGASGLRVSARSGFAAPVGSTFSGSGELRDTMVGLVPIRLDLGARLASHVYVGGGLQIGDVVARGCAEGAHCTGTDVRAFVIAAYHLFPTSILDPWVAIGTGFESLAVRREAAGSALALSARGIELVDGELGTDLRVSRLRVGPVVSATVSRYTSIVVNGVAASDFEPVAHVWVAFAGRAAYDF
jgi:hypothetical protein